MVFCPLFPWPTYSADAADSYHVHSSSPLTTSNQVHGARYSKYEVETDAVDLELETDATALKLEIDTVVLDLETETNMSQEILK
jgi:hypothetical protein